MAEILTRYSPGIQERSLICASQSEIFFIFHPTLKIPQSLTTRQPVNVLRILEQVCGITSLRFLKYLTSVGPLSYRQYSYKKTCIWISRYFIFSKKRSLNGCCLCLTKFRRKYFACWSSLQESLGIF